MTTMTTILGAGGPIGNELAKILAASNQPFRLVSCRKPTPVAGAEVLAADLADREQCIQAVAGSRVVHLLVGLKYDLAVWRELWPRIMANTIEACKGAQAGLIFFDNVYMYGKANGPMTEKTPYAPCSKKGEIRAKIATTLMNEVKAGNLKARSHAEANSLPEMIDARHYPRFKLEIDIGISSRSCGLLKGHTVDISESGISALLRIEVPLGEVVELDFTLPFGPVTIYAIVRPRKKCFSLRVQVC